MRTQTQLRAALALLLVATSVLFAIGTTIERSQRHNETGSADTAASQNQSEGSSSEAGGEGGGGETGSGESTSGETQTESSEKVFGIDVESVPAVVGAVAAALLLAAAVWWRRERLWLWATLGFGIAFAAGDVREVIHQLDESNAGVAVIAGVLVVAHFAIAVLAALLLARRAHREELAGRAPS
jgi:hypothetical protein